MRLAGKRVVITGAGGGIGRATAEKCAAEGAAVICADLHAAPAEAAAAAIVTAGGKAATVIGNLTIESDCEAMFAKGAEILGGI